MSVRRAIIEADTTTMNVTAFCRAHGVSTWFFWDLRRRYRVEGDVVLEPKSRAPHRPAGRTPSDIEDLIVAKRKELQDNGLDAGPATIAFHLKHLSGLPSESTIWRILTDRGLIIAQPHKAPKHTGRSFNAERANECWALDDTKWDLADGTIVMILNVIDDHSRSCVASTAMSSCTGAAALDTLASAAAEFGWPQRVWSDNAKAFKDTLAAALSPIGIDSGQSRPYRPQGNGKVERFHQTLQKWLNAQTTATSITELQAQLDEFRHIYNTQRPHRSIGRQFPAQVWHNAPKTGPSIASVGTATKVGHPTVHNGRCSLGSNQVITVGAKHNGKKALTVTTGDSCHIFVEGHLVRELTIDWTRRTQPLYDKPGQPKPNREV